MDANGISMVRAIKQLEMCLWERLFALLSRSSLFDRSLDHGSVVLSERPRITRRWYMKTLAVHRVASESPPNNLSLAILMLILRKQGTCFNLWVWARVNNCSRIANNNNNTNLTTIARAKKRPAPIRGLRSRFTLLFAPTCHHYRCCSRDQIQFKFKRPSRIWIWIWIHFHSFKWVSCKFGAFAIQLSSG